MGKPALIELEGADGIVRTLSGPGMGDRGAELATAPADFYNTPFEAIYTAHAYERGSTYNGKRIKSMYPVFSVDIFGTKDRPWEYWDDEWATALTDDQDAFLWYTTPTRSSRRKLAVRLVNEMQFKPMRDPRLGEYGRVTMNCIAPDPFWYEETSVFDRWRCMVDTTDGHIEWGSVTVSNPTPYPIWIKWRVQDGPLPGVKWHLPDFSWGNKRHKRAIQDADRMLTLPELLGDEHLDIETDENTKREPVRSTKDTQIYLRMDGKAFVYPLRPYLDPVEVPVGVQNAPAGVGVRVECPRPWPKPWGLRR